MSNLLDKLQKNSTIKDTNILTDSKFFNDKDLIQTSVPAVNVALSGKLDGGLTPGLTVFAGPSKHFKTAFAMLLIKAHQEKYPDGVVLFYDSEFGAPKSYFETFDIDTSKVLHTPIADIEQLKHDVMQQVEVKHNKVRQRLAVLIWDAEKYLEEATKVDAVSDGRVAATPAEAAESEYVDDMVSTDTQELDWD